MSTTTRLEYSNDSSSHTYILRLAANSTLETRSQEFFRIFRNHRTDSDALSISLSVWGREVCVLIAQSPNDLVELLAQKIDDLRRKVLANPIDSSPLKVPMLANGRIYDEWMLNHIRTVCKQRSPYDMASLAESSPHPFATELLQWIDSLLSPTENEELTLLAEIIQELEHSWDHTQWLNQEEVLQEDETLAAMYYCHAARDILSVEREQDISSPFEAAILSLDTLLEVTTESIRVNLAALRQRLQEGERNLASTLQAIQEVNTQIQEALQGQINQARQDLDRLNTRLNGSETRARDLANRVGSLERDIVGCRSEVAQLRSQANKKGKGCIIA